MSIEVNSPSLQTALIGRQPIYGGDVRVFAYELLYRGGKVNQANFVDGDSATANVVLNTFLEIGLEQVVGQSHKAFINITRSILLQKLCHAIPADRVVLEILEDIEPDPPILDAITELADLGYTIALDDFVFHESLRPLVALADFVKVDIQSLPPETLEEHVRLLRQYPVKLLAEKVESHEEFEFCQSLGFDYYQGYFFCKPKIVEGRKVPANRVSLLMLLSKLQDQTIEVSKLEEVIKNDLSLSFKILRYVNSAYCGLPKKVDSIGQAACMVGVDRLRMWATLMALASLEEKPTELLVMAVIRAKMCECLGIALKQDSAERFFMTGLFSVLDAFFDCEISEILESLPLSPEISMALLTRAGLLGQTLNCITAYENGDWGAVQCGELEPHSIRDAYLEAIQWSSQILGSL